MTRYNRCHSTFIRTGTTQPMCHPACSHLLAYPLVILNEVKDLVQPPASPLPIPPNTSGPVWSRLKIQ